KLASANLETSLPPGSGVRCEASPGSPAAGGGGARRRARIGAAARNGIFAGTRRRFGVGEHVVRTWNFGEPGGEGMCPRAPHASAVSRGSVRDFEGRTA